MYTKLRSDTHTQHTSSATDKQLRRVGGEEDCVMTSHSLAVVVVVVVRVVCRISFANQQQETERGIEVKRGM